MLQRRLPTQIPGKALSSAAKEPSGHNVVRDIAMAREEYDKETHQEAYSLPQEDVSEERMTESIGEPVSKTEEPASLIQQESASIEEEQVKQDQIDDETDERISLKLEEGLPADQEDAKISEPGQAVQGEISSFKRRAYQQDRREQPLKGLAIGRQKYRLSCSR